MTRKDYILVAKELHDARLVVGEKERFGIDTVADFLAAAFYAENPRFDCEHFLAVIRGEKALDSRPARNGVQS